MKDKAIVKWLALGVEIEEEVVFNDSDDSGGPEVDEEEELKEAPCRATVDETEHQMIQICLHDCLEKLSILKCINQKNSPPNKSAFPVYQTIEQRFADTVNYETEQLSEDMKRYNDISIIYSVLSQTLDDLNKYYNYHSLIEAASILKRLAKEEDELLSNEANSVQLVNELRVKLDMQSKILDDKYQQKLDELRKLELEYEDAIGYGKLEMKYAESWEIARRHQGNLVLSEVENSYKETVNTCNLKTRQENQIHDDIVNYIEENSEDMQKEIQYWVERFDTELEFRDSELLRLRMERDTQMDKYVELRTSYEERKEFIEEWEKVLEKRRIQAELLMKQTRAAIKIQAWWRGVMYRKKLGPYRKKKKKGKGKDKKGKGKKK